ncbi:MAG TPA: Na/Pi cotransporter family protein [Firmicutes bacterium]|mgnify:FL=1|nr:Na/Pi cotransporter family protein [Bacillota bacterium]
MEIEWQSMLFQFAGGLGIFLLGIKYMGEGLQKSAGNRLRDILHTFTSTPIRAVFAGILVTALIQSSSGTTVITVGLVNAGFIGLRQAIGIIMGANIGTTVTAFIIGVDIAEYALPILAVGALLLFFFTNKRIQYIGQFLFGFGALFYGLELMGAGMAPLQKLEAFQTLMITMSDNSLLAVFVGVIFTMLVQSSSATIGVLQELFAQGALPLQGALPVLFGDNIGTTITALLASIGTTIAARRAAFTHALFNIIGAIIFLLLLSPYMAFVEWLQTVLNLDPKMTIAFAHGSFNITNVLIQLPFISVLAYIVTKMIPGEERVIDTNLNLLDTNFIQQSPAIALTQAKEAVIKMSGLAAEAVREAKGYTFTQQQNHMDYVLSLESAIDSFDHKITDYLVKVSSANLSVPESESLQRYMNVVKDYERIGDHLENIVELVEEHKSSKFHLSEGALRDLEEMFSVVLEIVELSSQAFEEKDEEKALRIMQLEGTVDEMERFFRKKHIQRMSEGACYSNAGIIFVDILSNLERISDHCVNIAEVVLGKRG